MLSLSLLPPFGKNIALFKVHFSLIHFATYTILHLVPPSNKPLLIYTLGLVTCVATSIRVCNSPWFSNRYLLINFLGVVD